MGSTLELNDTLLLTAEQGFPKDKLNLQQHQKQGISLHDLADQTFTFTKDGARVFHLDPVRVFLVQKIEGKWLFWGNALIQSQTIRKSPRDGQWVTTGQFIVSKIYDPETQRLFTNHESPSGKGFFDNESKP